MSDYYATAEATLPLWTAARKTDPPTSHAAAARAKKFRGGHCKRILEALAVGPAGQTEIAARTGMSVAAVSKRLPDLRRDGDIERTGREVAGGECEYRATAATCGLQADGGHGWQVTG